MSDKVRFQAMFHVPGEGVPLRYIGFIPRELWDDSTGRPVAVEAMMQNALDGLVDKVKREYRCKSKQE